MGELGRRCHRNRCWGSERHVSQAIAASYPNLKFIVRDLPEVMESAKNAKDSEWKERIEFAAYNILNPQTQRGNVYLFRWVLHDWPDAYDVRIVRSQIPMLVEDAKIVIDEQLLPDPPSMPLVIE